MVGIDYLGMDAVPGAIVLDEEGEVFAPSVESVDEQAASMRKAAATAANRRPAFGDFIRVISF